MAFKIFYLADAKQDIIEAKKWYKNQKAGLEEQLVFHINRKIKDILKMPTAFPFRIENIRFAQTTKFPYNINFVVNEADEEIYIISFVHRKRLKIK